MPTTPDLNVDDVDAVGAVELPDDEWDDVDLEDDPTGTHEGTGEEAQEPYFPNVDVFVHEFLAPTYRRSLEGNHRVWCAEWWRHAEAINRLESLWRAWEHLRLDPATGMSIWWRDHADHHMPALLAPDGPFKGCGSDRGHQPRATALPVSSAPPGLFQ
ncbi:DUF4913 domain-containing protein [Jannaschia sp. R86511]|uniref:DUF4913 domain-containing protein n=1 Tax=Jannaschia sp. R86511 TaxID=3093853 RepID=UPI0036D41400